MADKNQAARGWAHTRTTVRTATGAAFGERNTIHNHHYGPQPPLPGGRHRWLLMILAAAILAAATVVAWRTLRPGTPVLEQHAVTNLLTDPAGRVVRHGESVRLSLPPSWHRFRTITLTVRLTRVDGDHGAGSCVAPATMTVIPALDDKDLAVTGNVRNGQPVPVEVSGSGHELQIKIEVRLTDHLCRLRLGGSVVFR